MFNKLGIGIAVVFIIVVLITMCGCALFERPDKLDGAKNTIEKPEHNNRGIFAKTSTKTNKTDESVNINVGGSPESLRNPDGTLTNNTYDPVKDSLSALMLLEAVNKGKLDVANVENKWKTYAIGALAGLAGLFLLMRSPIDKAIGLIRKGS